MGYLRFTDPGNVASYDCSILSMMNHSFWTQYMGSTSLPLRLPSHQVYRVKAVEMLKGTKGNRGLYFSTSPQSSEKIFYTLTEMR